MLYVEFTRTTFDTKLLSRSDAVVKRCSDGRNGDCKSALAAVSLYRNRTMRPLVIGVAAVPVNSVLEKCCREAAREQQRRHGTLTSMHSNADRVAQRGVRVDGAAKHVQRSRRANTCSGENRKEEEEEQDEQHQLFRFVLDECRSFLN